MCALCSVWWFRWLVVMGLRLRSGRDMFFLCVCWCCTGSIYIWCVHFLISSPLYRVICSNSWSNFHRCFLISWVLVWFSILSSVYMKLLFSNWKHHQISKAAAGFVDVVSFSSVYGNIHYQCRFSWKNPLNITYKWQFLIHRGFLNWW